MITRKYVIKKWCEIRFAYFLGQIFVLKDVKPKLLSYMNVNSYTYFFLILQIYLYENFLYIQIDDIHVDEKSFFVS